MRSRSGCALQCTRLRCQGFSYTEAVNGNDKGQCHLQHNTDGVTFNNNVHAEYFTKGGGDQNC